MAELYGTRMFDFFLKLLKAYLCIIFICLKKEPYFIFQLFFYFKGGRTHMEINSLYGMQSFIEVDCYTGM